MTRLGDDRAPAARISPRRPARTGTRAVPAAVAPASPSLRFSLGLGTPGRPAAGADRHRRLRRAAPRGGELRGGADRRRRADPGGALRRYHPCGAGRPSAGAGRNCPLPVSPPLRLPPIHSPRRPWLTEESSCPNVNNASYSPPLWPRCSASAGSPSTTRRPQPPRRPRLRPPSPSTSAPVASRAVTEWQEYSGRLEAIERVDIHPQVSGILTAGPFQGRQPGPQGRPVVHIDSRPLRRRTGASAGAARPAREGARRLYRQRPGARRTLARRERHRASRLRREAERRAREAVANVQAAPRRRCAWRSSTSTTRASRRRRSPAAFRAAEVTVGNLVAPGQQPGADHPWFRPSASTPPSTSTNRVTSRSSIAPQGQSLPIHLGPRRRRRLFARRASRFGRQSARQQFPERSACAPSSTTRTVAWSPVFTRASGSAARVRVRSC